MTIFVIFEGKIPVSKSAIGEQYYGTLQELLKTHSGFLSETPYLSVDQEGQQVLVGRFTDEESLHNWRRQSTHLRIEKKSRDNLFIDYRIRVGPEVVGVNTGRETQSAVGKFVVLYEYPAAGSAPLPKEQKMGTLEAWKGLVDAATYQGEQGMLQISAWKSKAEAMKIVDLIPCLDGDSIHLIHVERDYGKYNRREAPADTDEVQATALASEQRSEA